MFVEEAKEHLTTLNQALLDFEKNPKDKEAMNKIFRAAHTIKGMSAAMNYNTIQQLSHKTEDALDLIRNNKLTVDEKLINLIFDCFDGIEAMVNEIEVNNMTEFDITGLIEELEQKMNSPSDQQETPQKSPPITSSKKPNLKLDVSSEETIRNDLAKGKLAYDIFIAVDNTCAMKSIRAFMVLAELKKKGSIITSEPDLQSIENGEFEEGFNLYYVSDSSLEDIQKIVNSISELSTKEVMPIIQNETGLYLESGVSKPDAETTAPHTSPQPQDTPTKLTQKKSPSRIMNSQVQSIRIGMDQLDHFMNLIGELVISKGRLSQIANQHKLEDLSETTNTVDRLTTELQDKIMQIRMIPMKQIFDRFPRMIRDLAKNNGKQVNLIIEGEGIELDRTILEEIGDPLVHLLRNAVDHGIEPPEERKKQGKPEEGTVRLIAERTRNHVLIRIEDDGKGLDPEVLKQAALKKGLKTEEELQILDEKQAYDLMFLPGLSSAEKITNVSGRGVGMDVVKSTIDELNGSIDITSEVGKGSTFSLRLPLTMAIFKALFVGVTDETYAIPISNVLETVHLTQNDINIIKGKQTTVLRNEILPLISLHDCLDVSRANREYSSMYAVVLQREKDKLGLVVDRLIGEQEITIKNINTSLKRSKGIAGVTITGDGRVILVLDVNSLT